MLKYTFTTYGFQYIMGAFKIGDCMDYVTTDVVLKELKITRPTLRRYCRAGMPHYRAPGPRSRYKFKLEEITDWLHQGKERVSV